MSSYNQIKSHANENYHLLTEIRAMSRLCGMVVTDWGGDNDHPRAEGRSNLYAHPRPDCPIGLVKAVQEGRVSEKSLDERLRELLKVVFATSAAVAEAPKSYDQEAHHALARRCAAGSIVLLENDGILPLKADAKVAVIGDFAETPRYQGAGSSMVNPTRLDNLK